MNLLSYILCYFMLAYRVKAIIIIFITSRNRKKYLRIFPPWTVSINTKCNK